MRRRAEATAGGGAVVRDSDTEVMITAPRHIAPADAAPLASPSSNDSLLNLLKEEMFDIEREKLSGDLPLDEYVAIKAGLEALLRRALHVQKPRKTTQSTASEDR